MAITYTEFDTTMGTFIKDVRAAILANTDWSYLGYATQIAATTAASAINATSMTFTSGTIPAAVIVGSRIRIDDYATNQYEYRDVTGVTATTISFAALTYAHASGTKIYWGAEVFKATTVRGADMIFDLTGGGIPSLARVALGVYGAYTAPNGTTNGVATNGAINKYLHWRRTAGSAANPVHVILSTSKDHFFISVEGPRGSETGTYNGAYGSQRMYFFMADLVPYSVTDTIPTVVCGGEYVDSTDSSVANKSYIVNISKSLAGTQYWGEGKLLTLTFPQIYTGDAIGAQRYTLADSEYYLSPYVVASDEAGFRGRLNNLYFAGFNTADNADGVYPMVGANVVYNGITFELQAVTKSDASNRNWGPFGAVANEGGTTYWRSPVVAIPVA